MARKSSDTATGSVAPGRADIRALNADMVARLLDAGPQPLAEGSYALRVVETSGCRSGRARRTPLGLTRLDDRRYLVSPQARRDWVRNLRTHPICVIAAGTDRERVRAVPVGGDEAATVVGTYLAAVQVPWARRAFPVGPDASREEITAHLDSIAVFRLDQPGSVAAGDTEGGHGA